METLSSESLTKYLEWMQLRFDELAETLPARALSDRRLLWKLFCEDFQNKQMTFEELNQEGQYLTRAEL